MKKAAYMVLILVFILNVFSCSSQKENNGSESNSSDEFDIKIASNILDSYLRYVYSGDNENASKYYNKELLKDQTNVENTDLKIFGYKVLEVNEAGKSSIFKVRFTKGTLNKTFAVLDTYNIKIVKENNEYKISNIQSNTEKEVFQQDNSLRLRDRNNIKTSLVIDKTGIPEYTFPKEDGGKINKVPVMKDSYGLINFNYSGEMMIITTKANQSFAGVVKIDETISAQGEGKSGGGSAGAGGGDSSGGSAGSGVFTKEKPIGKDITSLDIVKDCDIQLANFSLDEKYVIIQYFNTTNKSTFLRLYNTENGELADYSFEKNFPKDKLNVEFSSFDKDVLNFEVKETDKTDKNQASTIGKWQLNLKTNKAVKI